MRKWGVGTGLAIPLIYGISTCEFDGCKAVFAVGLGADLLAVLPITVGLE